MPIAFKKLIKHLDAFGQPVGLTYKGSTRYKTIFGGSLTILLTLIVLLLSLQSIRRLLYREKIFVSTSSISSFDPPELEIPFEEGFYFALGYNPDGLNNLTHRPFIITVEQKKYKRDPNGTRYLVSEKKHALEACEKRHFPENYDYIKNGHKNWLCFPRNSTFTLKGQFESDEFEYIKISVSKCKNSSTNDFSCMNQETFTNITKQGREGSFYFKLALSSHLFNLQNFKEPTFLYMETSAFFLVDPSNSYKSVDVFIKHNTVTTDYDLIYENPHSKIIPSYQNYREQTAGLSGDTYAAIFLRCALERTMYEGSAEKFSVILANFGGLLSTIFALFFFVLKYFNRKRLMISLSNILYHFDFEERESFVESQPIRERHPRKTEEPARTTQLETEDPLSHKNYESYLEVPMRNPVRESRDPRLIGCLGMYTKALDAARVLNAGNELDAGKVLDEGKELENTVVKCDNRKMEKESFLKNITGYLGRFKKLKISWATILASLICCRRNLKINKKGKLARKAFKKIGRDMDIIQVLKKVKEVDRLKEFLFSQKQKVIFEFFPREVVKLKFMDRDLDPQFLTDSRKSSLNKFKKKIQSDFLRKLAARHLSYIEKGPISVYLELFDAYKDLNRKEDDSKQTGKLISMLGDDVIKILGDERNNDKENLNLT